MLGGGLLLGLLALQAIPAAGAFRARVYVTNAGSASVSVFDHDTATNLIQRVGTPIPVGRAPVGIAITPDRTQVYVANAGSDSVSRLFGTPIPVEHQPWGIAITPDGAYAYVTNRLSDSVSVFATATKQIVARVLLATESGPAGIAITPDGTHAYVTNVYSDSVLVIDTATNQVVGDPIPVGRGLVGIAITPDGTRAYVTNNFSDSVLVIDTATNQVVGDPIPVGRAPDGIAITPDGAYAYVTNWASNNVSLINTRSNEAVGEPIPVGNQPTRISSTSHLNAIINFGPTFWTPGSIYPLTRLPTTFTAAVDEASLVASVTWDFYGDGTVVATTSTLSTQYTYTRAGTFTPQVTVALTDGSQAAATTTLLVQSPAEALATAVSLVDWLALPTGPTTSLVSKLTAAQAAITRGNQKAACQQLQAFEDEVQALVKGGQLDQASATPRLSQAQAIQVSPGYRGTSSQRRVQPLHGRPPPRLASSACSPPGKGRRQRAG
jgi:YVTN family beta-propeller protein